MESPYSYAFSAYLSTGHNSGRIDRSDGATVPIPGPELPSLFIDLSVDDHGRPGYSQYHTAVLHQWFERLRARPRLAAVR